MSWPSLHKWLREEIYSERLMRMDSVSSLLIYLYIAVTILGGGGLIYWMGRNIKALQGAVKDKERL